MLRNIFLNRETCIRMYENGLKKRKFLETVLHVEMVQDIYSILGLQFCQNKRYEKLEIKVFDLNSFNSFI